MEAEPGRRIPAESSCRHRLKGESVRLETRVQNLGALPPISSKRASFKDDARKIETMGQVESLFKFFQN